MKWSLPTLKPEVGALEVATIATTVSLGVSVVYNLGFFWDTEPSLISLLTIQDYAIGAMVGILPIFAPIVPFLVMPDMGLAGRGDPTRTEPGNTEGSMRRTIHSLARLSLEFVRRHRVIAYLVASTAITLLMVVAFVAPGLMVTWWLLAYLLVSAICFFVLAGLASGIELAFAGLTWVFVTAFLTGLGSYDAASAMSPDDRVVLAGEEVALGTIVRVSSNYVFMLADEGLTAIPTNKIGRIQNGLESIPDS